MMAFVTDTHSLVWHMTNDSRLSKKAKKIFNLTDQAKEVIYIPCIVLFELIYLIEKKKINLNLNNLFQALSLSSNYKVEPLCIPVISEVSLIPKRMIKDPWDRVIIATSKYLDMPLITKDKNISKSGLLNVVW